MANVRIYEADFQNDYVTSTCNVVVIEVKQINGNYTVYRFYDAINQIRIKGLRVRGGEIEIFIQSPSNSIIFDKIGTFKFSQISKREDSDKAGNSLDEVMNYIDQVISENCSY